MKLITPDDSNAVDNSPPVDELVPITNRKIDLSKAINLRYNKGVSITDIAALFGVTRQAVHKALKPFDTIVKDKQLVDAYNNNQVNILEGSLIDFVANMVDKGKLQKASLNNVAYAFDRVFNALRLLKGESTSNVLHADAHHNNLQDVEAAIAELEGTSTDGMSEEEVVEAEIMELQSGGTIDDEGE